MYIRTSLLKKEKNNKTIQFLFVVYVSIYIYIYINDDLHPNRSSTIF